MNFLLTVNNWRKGKITPAKKSPKYAESKRSKALTREWKGFLREQGFTDFNKEGILNNLKDINQDDLRRLVINWYDDPTRGSKNPPDGVKRQLFQAMTKYFGQDVSDFNLEKTKEASIRTDLSEATGVKWNLDHSREWSDKFFLDNVVTFLRYWDDADSQPERDAIFKLMHRTHTLGNISIMPDKLNLLKKDLNKAKTYEIWEEKASQLGYWYDVLKKELEKKDSNFAQAHLDAMKEFNKKFPKLIGVENEKIKPLTRYAIDLGNIDETAKLLYIQRNDTNFALRSLEQKSKFTEVDQEELEAARNKTAAYARKVRGNKDYSEHFSDQFWYQLTSYLWGKPVQSIRDFNKLSRFGTAQGTIKAADKIADLVQRAHSWDTRAKGEALGADLVQDISLKSGEFYSELFKVFAKVTNIVGAINNKNNAQLVDALLGKTDPNRSKKVDAAATELRNLVERVYKYARDETKGLVDLTGEDPLELRGHGDTLLPRVWNIEYLATRQGKAKLLRALSDAFSPPGKTTPVFEDAGITVEDLSLIHI